MIKNGKFTKEEIRYYSAQPFIDFPITHTFGKNDDVVMKKSDFKNITQLAEKIILQSYSPNCVLITESGEILYIHGKTGKYLELTNGEAKMNIFEMAREGLKQELPCIDQKSYNK
ncbi:MAG: hypothetical protein MZV64_05825 [Ignavibacteriales bacterium]|nr:hypothetical protein [Ignavibacteriales bacterium]